MTKAAILLALVLALGGSAAAQMSYRLKGTVKDDKGAPVAGARVRAEAIQGFRGEQFVGQKEFATRTNEKGEWSILGLTAGIWVFEATAPNLMPHVVVLPVQYTSRKPQSATGGQLSWDLPMTERNTTNEMLKKAAEAAVAGRSDEAVSLAGRTTEEKDPDTLCAAGHVALLVRQHGLAGVLFRQAATLDKKHACASLGLASAALMQGDVIGGSKLLWSARDLAAPTERRALAAAITDLQQIGAPK
jgi:hypothetical protein